MKQQMKIKENENMLHKVLIGENNNFNTNDNPFGHLGRYII